MRSSYRIFKIFGISVELHITFLIFILILLLWFKISDIVFYLIIFSIVLAHELCHSISAKLSGIPVPRIILIPFGGLASIELPENPLLELKISIAGPIFNFILATICAILLIQFNIDFVSYSDLIEQLNEGTLSVFSGSYILNMLFFVNLILGLFNILPAFPMDGGRVLRSVLALWTDYISATKIATSVGQFIFILMMVVGVITLDFWLALIGLFLSYAGRSELKYVGLKRAFQGMTVGQIAITKINYVYDSLSIRDFFRIVAKQDQSIYLATDSAGKITGILDIHDIQGIDPKKFGEVIVKNVIRKKFDIVDSNVPVENLLKKMLTTDFLLVTDSNKVVGYLTPDHISEIILFYEAQSSNGK